MTHDTTSLKKKLLEEKSLLEKQFAEIGIKDKETGDWEATPEASDHQADDNDLADKFEDYEERNATLNSLEPRLREIDEALAKIESNDTSYGTCSVCGKDIEEDRLDANPAATTCKEHMN